MIKKPLFIPKQEYDSGSSLNNNQQLYNDNGIINPIQGHTLLPAQNIYIEYINDLNQEQFNMQQETNILFQ
ncbi:3379_t:CDS:1, partial [Racocetra persica]